MAELKPAHEKALALAALCGFKIALGPAFLRASQRSASTQSWTSAALETSPGTASLSGARGQRLLGVEPASTRMARTWAEKEQT